MSEPAAPVLSLPSRRLVGRAALAAYVIAVGGLVVLVTIGLFFAIGEPWGTLNDLAFIVVVLAVGPLMLAFWELGGWTPTPLALVAQAAGWIAVLGWCFIHALFIAGALRFDYKAPAAGGLALEAVAQVVIGLWIGGANLLAGRWLGWQRWLGVVAGVGWVLVGIGLLAGGMNHPLSYAGGAGYLVIFPIWAYLMARLLTAIAAGAATLRPAPAR
jgi:hypothetical protein